MAAFSELLEQLLPYLPLLTGVSLVGWVVGWTVYNRFFHPLAHIPGPFLGSVTELYRFYYNYIRKGSFYHKFDELKEKYGPVVRISPNEVFLTDPDNYDKIYAMNNGFYKDPGFYSLIGVDSAIFSIISNEKHRRHRAILNPYFSRRAVLDQEKVVQAKTAKLCARIERDSAKGVPTDIAMGFRAISIDVITEYAFGADSCYNSLDAEDFGVWYNRLVRGVAPMVYVFKIFPPLQKPLQGMPYWLAKRINPVVISFMEVTMVAKKQVENVILEIKNGIKPKQTTIFHTILEPPNAEKDYEAPSAEHMVENAFGLTGAAAETAGNAMTMSAFHVLFNPAIFAKLHKELVDAFPDPATPLDFLTLEKLPYLTGVIKEGLRLSYGVIYPLPRVVPEGGATFNGYFVPEGSVVAMSNWTMHRDLSAFPDPDTFDPSRWLDPETTRYREKFLTGFSRGPRTCIGQPLAMCELYVSIAQLFRRFGDLKAHDVGPEDMVYEDYFSPFHPLDARKFRVLRSESGK